MENNAGTLRLGNPAALGTGPATVNSGGILSMGGNTITNVVTLTAGSTLVGNGTLTAAADTVAGNISPGTGNGTGTLNFFNSSVNFTGNCAMQIDGNGSSDVITTSGNLSVSGTVTVTLVNSDVPAFGHTFDLFSQPNSLFANGTLLLPALPAGLTASSYVVQINTTDLNGQTSGWSNASLGVDYTENVSSNVGVDTITITLTGLTSGKRFARVSVTY